MSNIYLTSDHHFNNKNISKYTNRPFSNEWEMDEALTENWNKLIKPNDIAYHLGDLTFSTHTPYIEKLFKSLNGKIYLVKGNHDYFARKPYFQHRFEWIRDYFELNHNNRKIILCHYPILSWKNMRHGSFHFHGHSHSRLDELNKTTLRYDVGVDSHNLFPVHIDEIFQTLEAREKQIKIDRPENTFEDD